MLLEEALALSTTGEFEATPYYAGQIRSLTGLGYVSRISGSLNDAMSYLTAAKQLCEATGLLQAIVFVNLGSLYVLLGDLLQSLEAYERGLAAARQASDSHYEIEALMGIANIYAMRADFSEATEYVGQSLELSIKLHYLTGQLRASNNLAAYYQSMGDYENALLTVENVLPLIDTEKHVFETIYLLSTAGEVQFSLGNYPHALERLQEALRLAERTGIIEPIPPLLIVMSKIYQEQDETELEIEILERGIKVSEALKHQESHHVYHQRLAAIYERQGKFETALKHYQVFHEIKETIFNEAAEQKLKHMQVLHETETHKQNAEIERLKNVELLQAKETVEAANRVKSAFLANMSHELRTPINAILGFAQLMQYDAALSTANKENLNTIIRSGEHLLALISDVLDMSKIEAEKMTVQTSAFDCYQLFDELEMMFSLRVKQKNLKFNLECSPKVPQWIKSDERKLRQVLLNLIDNAIKFTSHGHVDLRIRYANSRLYFEIEDTGHGIAPEDLKALFTPFQQLQREEATEKGTGLGLAISQAFVQLLGDGCITVTSEPEKGSLFRFDIPVEESSRYGWSEPVSTQHVKTLEAGQPRFRVLVADDHTDSRAALAGLLALVGFEVQEAVNGKQAVDASREWHPHLILMDLRMPELDGYEATRQIKRNDAEIIIIAVTSNGTRDAKVSEAGFDDFILKPVQRDLIFEVIARYLNVKYVYEEGANSKLRELPDDDSIHELLQAQPVVWRKKIHHYANAGNRNEILKLADEIDLQHKELADIIRTLMKAYQFDKLISFVEPDVN